MNRFHATSLLIALAVAAPARAQQAGVFEAFESTMRAHVAAEGVVGASALFMKDGRVQRRVILGDADRDAGAIVTESTIFHWGSITKTLTAVSIMQLRDRGRLSLDDRVVDHLPELRRVHDPYGMRDSITIRMLLAHTAGFQGSTWPYDQGREWEPFEPTSWDQLVAMMPFEQLQFRPGSRFGYSNPGYIYLARIIEQLTGDPWEDYVRKNIFMPLGMERSYFRTTPQYLAQHRSHGYTIARANAQAAAVVNDNGADFDTGITTPNGGWNAPLDDLAAWAAFLTGTPLFTPGSNDDVLSRNSLAEMWRGVYEMNTASAGGAGGDTKMGLSFFVVSREGHTLYGHTGSQAGYRSFLYFNPLNRTAVIASFNTTNYANSDSAGWAALQEAAYRLLW